MEHQASSYSRDAVSGAPLRSSPRHLGGAGSRTTPRHRALLVVALALSCAACEERPQTRELLPAPAAVEPESEAVHGRTTVDARPAADAGEPTRLDSEVITPRCRPMLELQAGDSGTFVSRPVTAKVGSRPRRSEPAAAEQLVMHLERVSRRPGHTALDAWGNGLLNPAGNLTAGLRVADLEALPVPTHDLRISRFFDPCAHHLAAGDCWRSEVRSDAQIAAGGGAILRSGRSHHIGIKAFPPGDLEGTRLGSEDVADWTFRDRLERAYSGDFMVMSPVRGTDELLLRRLTDGRAWRLVYLSDEDYDRNTDPLGSHLAISPNDTWFALRNPAGQVYRWDLTNASPSGSVPAQRLMDEPEALRQLAVHDTGAVVGSVAEYGGGDDVVWPADEHAWVDLRDRTGKPAVAHARGDLLVLSYIEEERPLLEIHRGGDVVFRTHAARGSVSVSPNEALLAWADSGGFRVAPLDEPTHCHVAAGTGYSAGWTHDNALHFVHLVSGTPHLWTIRDFRVERRRLLPASATAEPQHSAIRRGRWLEYALPQRLLAWDLLNLPPVHHRPRGRLHWHPDGEWAVVITPTRLTRFDLREGGTPATLDLGHRLGNYHLAWMRESDMDGYPSRQGIGMGPPAVFLPDGSLVFSQQGGGLFRWHANGERSSLTPETETISRVWVRDTVLLATTENTLHAWRLEDAEPTGHQTWTFPGPIRGATHDPRTGRVWFVDTSGAHLWDAATQEATTLCTSTQINDIDLLAGEPWLLEHDSLILEHGIECSESDRPLHGPRFMANASQLGVRGHLVWSHLDRPNPRDKSLVVVDLRSGRTWELEGLTPPGAERIPSVVVPAPDGESFLVTLADGRVLRWWFRRGRIEFMMHVADGRGSVQVSPDGRRLWIDDPIGGLRSIPMGPTGPDFASMAPFPVRGLLR